MVSVFVKYFTFRLCLEEGTLAGDCPGIPLSKSENMSDRDYAMQTEMNRKGTVWVVETVIDLS